MTFGRKIVSSMCLCTYTKRTTRNHVFVPVQSKHILYIHAATLNSSKQHKYYSISGRGNSHKLSLTTKTTKDWSKSDNFDASISGFAVFGATVLAYGVYTHISK